MMELFCKLLWLYFMAIEKSSLYKLHLMGFDAYFIIMKNRKFDKGVFKPFSWIKKGVFMMKWILYYLLFCSGCYLKYQVVDISWKAEK